MDIGNVIRRYRKEHRMTQEEMANRLGVTAPAVNKWENGNSYPDIALLAPIARLLGISTDTLLGFKEELTQREVSQMINELAQMLKEQDYDLAFQWSQKKIQEYPSCEWLILSMAQVLDGYRSILHIQEPEKYEDEIIRLYERCRASQDRDIAQCALTALFSLSVSKEDYGQAQRYLDELPGQRYNPDRFQAALYKKQGKLEDACERYEQLLFSSYGDMSWAFQGMMSLALEEHDMDRAEWIAGKQKALAKLMEAGKYQEITPDLELALERKDKDSVLSILSELTHSMSAIDSFKDSELYRHMKFQENGSGASEFIFMLKKGLETDESMEYIKDDIRYKELMDDLENL